MHIKEPEITARYHDIIAGTVLGGSSITKPARGKNSYLSMRSKNNLWLEYKAQELSVWASTEPFTIEKTLRWHSLCYPVFNRFRDVFYRDGQRCLEWDTLEHLRLHDVGLAIWYGDCGSYRNGKIVLKTHIWGQKGTGVIAEYFSAIGCAGVVRQEKKCWRFVMEDRNAQRFLELVLPHLPPFMA